MSEQPPDSVADASTRPSLATLLDTLARFQSAALLYPPTHRRVGESSSALVNALRGTADLRGEVRFAIDDGQLLHDGAPIVDLTGPAKKLVGEWDGLGIAKLTFLPTLVPDDLVAFARFLKEATTQIVGGHRPTLGSFELVPHSIDIVSRDYGRPHRESARPATAPGEEGKGGHGVGGGEGDAAGPGSLQPVAAPLDPSEDEERAAREATALRDAGVPELAVDELARRLGATGAPGATGAAGYDVAALDALDRVAALEWLLHLLRRPDRPPAFRAALVARLASLLIVGCDAEEEKALTAGLLPLARADAAAELAQLLDALTPVIRGFGAERPAALLVQLFDECGAAARKVVWLRLVQELLLSLGVNGEAVERHALARLAKVDAAEWKAAAHELAELRVIRTRSYAPGALSPMRRGLYGFYLALLRIGGPIADELVRSFVQCPPPTPAGGAFYAMRNDMTESRLFLVRFLAATEADESALRRQAAAMLRTTFEALDPQRRNDPWVPHAIAALRRLPSPEAERALAQIRDERRFFFFPVWPKTCRDAAAGRAS